MFMFKNKIRPHDKQNDTDKQKRFGFGRQPFWATREVPVLPL